MAGRVDEARVTLRRAADEANRIGHAIAEMYIWHNLGWWELAERDFEAARAALRHAMDLNRRIVDHTVATSGVLGLGYAELGLGHTLDARGHFAALLDLVLRPRPPFPRTSRTPHTGSRWLPTPPGTGSPSYFARVSRRGVQPMDSDTTPDLSRHGNRPSPSASIAAAMRVGRRLPR